MSGLAAMSELAQQQCGQDAALVPVFSHHHHPQSASGVVFLHGLDVFAVNIQSRDMEAVADGIYGTGAGEDAVNLVGSA
jgi:hypothetical protein